MIVRKRSAHGQQKHGDEVREQRTSNTDERPVAKLGLDRPLNLVVRLKVDRRARKFVSEPNIDLYTNSRRLIKDNDPRILHQRTRKTQQTTFSNTQIRTFGLYRCVQSEPRRWRAAS